MSAGLGNASSAQLETAIVNAIESALFEMHTGLPAKIVTYDREHQSCNVQPLLQRVYLDENDEHQVFTLPQVVNVPIVFPSGGGFAISWPLSLGDVVYLAFAERSLDTWLSAAKGSLVDPLESRKFHLSDAVAIPGMRQRGSAIANASATSMIIGREDGTALVEITAEGKMILTASMQLLLGGDDAAQSVVLGEALVAAYGAHTHAVAALGTSSPPAPLTGVLSALVKVK